MNTRLIRKNFIAWLQSKRPRARVGQEMHCPLDCFLGESRGLNKANIPASVGSRTYIVKGLSRNLPKWAVQFVYDVDHRPGYWNSITAQRALNLLEHPNQSTEVTF